MPVFLGIFVLSIASIHLAALSFGWYVHLTGFDIPMHILAGTWLACALWYYVFEKTDSVSFRNKWVAVLLGVGAVALVGVFWEMYEFFGDVFIRHSHPFWTEPGWIYADTLKDLLDDSIGAAIAMLLLVKLRWKKLPR
ncbi:MAG TPA: hypothetical protein VNG29_01745 [Candidatus Paceibacterota bacterium]|nr:hypothetical protein [Candidatus Paceibacterota bacterium]